MLPTKLLVDVCKGSSCQLDHGSAPLMEPEVNSTRYFALPPFTITSLAPTVLIGLYWGHANNHVNDWTHIAR